jgi:hypothetical protein
MGSQTPWRTGVHNPSDRLSTAGPAQASVLIQGGRRLEDILFEANAEKQRDYVDALWIDAIYRTHGTNSLLAEARTLLRWFPRAKRLRPVQEGAAHLQRQGMSEDKSFFQNQNPLIPGDLSD